MQSPNVIEAHSRFRRVIRVGRGGKAMGLVAVLEDLTSFEPAPAFSRGDNGNAFI